MFFAIIIALLICVFVVNILINARARMYQYDCADDYLYENLESIDGLKVDKNHLSYGKNKDESVSVFLVIKLKSYTKAKLFRPYVTLKSNDAVAVHYFEHAANGVRYLNISHYEPTSFTLLGTYCEAEVLKIVTSKTSAILQGTSIIIGPHPDDNEIAAFSFFNSQSIYINVTAGQYNNSRFNKLYKNKSIALQKQGVFRSIDSIASPLAFGISKDNIHNFGYFCQNLRNMYANRLVTCASKFNGLMLEPALFRDVKINAFLPSDNFSHTWQSMVSDFELCFSKNAFINVVLPDPRTDSHEDHQFTTLAAIEALVNLGIKDVNLLFYTNHLINSEFFPYGARHAPISLPPQFEENFKYDSILSVPLSATTQADKFIALQMMHDLRSGVEFEDLKGRFKHIVLLLKSLIHDDGNYFDRAVRGNELFFVISINHFYKQDFRDDFFKSINGYHSE